MRIRPSCFMKGEVGDAHLFLFRLLVYGNPVAR
jgi:hypothetical protein